MNKNFAYFMVMVIGMIVLGFICGYGVLEICGIALIAIGASGLK